MSMPFYASAEQIMRDRSEYARKNIARGRPVVVLTYVDGVLFVAENPSTTLHKVGEIYDRIGFAAVGRYSEYETLRIAGIRLADVRGYSYDRRDVTGRALANAYAQTLNSIFTEQQKPYEVELCVAEVGGAAEDDRLYRLTYDGSIVEEPEYVALGGQTEPIIAALKEGFRHELPLPEALRLATRGLAAVGADGGKPRELAPGQLEVAVLDRNRPSRKFRRLVGAALAGLLPGAGGGQGAAAAGPDGSAAGEPLGSGAGNGGPPAGEGSAGGSAGAAPRAGGSESGTGDSGTEGSATPATHGAPEADEDPSPS